ncbi:MAG: hypothetical protein CMJ45_05685 [Planctomyces sp.]|nr:hypothetical protein [Planctomyces sp.]
MLTPANTPAAIPPTSIPRPAVTPREFADVIDVSISGKPGDYRFSVTVSSPDTGCAQYADWWEVVSADGRLVYRRVLLHSHSGEQPFTRSGGPVDVQADEVVIVRGHMNGTGYGGSGLKGSVSSDFAITDIAGDFGADLAQQDPLPTGCAF